jgi:hypothetical protein
MNALLRLLMVAALVLLALSVMPGVLAGVARLTGIAELSTALLYLIMLVFLGVFYRFSAVISDLKDTNIALVQKVAILEYEIRALHEKAS